MLSDSIPPWSASSIAVRSTRSRLSGTRGSGVALAAFAICILTLSPIASLTDLHRTSSVARLRLTVYVRCPMKAVAYHRYGSPDVLQLQDVDTPKVGDDGVLVRVRASSVNPVDWHILRGEPFMVRMSDGLRRRNGWQVRVGAASVGAAA